MAAAEPTAVAVAEPPRRTNDDAAASEHDQQYADAIKSRFQELFDQFVSGMSIQHFEPLFNSVITSNTTLSSQRVLADFKAKLSSMIAADFHTFWTDYNVPDGLVLLRDVQALTKPDAPPGWRPTAKSALEQTRFFRVFILRKKIAYLEKQIPYHADAINNLAEKVHTKRTQLNELVLRRQELTTRINRKLDEIDDVSEES